MKCDIREDPTETFKGSEFTWYVKYEKRIIDGTEVGVKRMCNGEHHEITVGNKGFGGRCPQKKYEEAVERSRKALGDIITEPFEAVTKYSSKFNAWANSNQPVLILTGKHRTAFGVTCMRQSNRLVLYITTVNLRKLFEDKFDDERKTEAKDQIETLRAADILMIDNIGSEGVGTPRWKGEFFGLIFDRGLANRKTVLGLSRDKDKLNVADELQDLINTAIEKGWSIAPEEKNERNQDKNHG